MLLYKEFTFLVTIKVTSNFQGMFTLTLMASSTLARPGRYALPCMVPFSNCLVEHVSTDGSTPVGLCWKTNSQYSIQNYAGTPALSQGTIYFSPWYITNTPWTGPSTTANICTQRTALSLKCDRDLVTQDISDVWHSHAVSFHWYYKYKCILSDVH